ncbi:transporter substrate-binding domain-containing protein [Nitrincola tapanii]|uniref:Transporter substrate-binding domain-containing protein n=1 Tax=Nitrincola tapanii TaxID=1708751 RepID=A0A5A9VZ91_9GAMM|nr:transporter substrate-binding domain-containing protein [Nitrincola tapanii]KAA0873632.1 transporter substrate-binding domain-containing protein [Nitrincola tapanii]
MIKIILSLLLGLSVSWNVALAQPLRIATEGAYPPFSYWNDQGQLAGFDIEIAQVLCQAMQRECQIQAVEWSHIIEGLEQDQYDLVIASMAKTPERERRVDFTDYYYRSHSIFVGDPSRFQEVSAEALQGVRIATGRDTIMSDYLQATYPLSELHLTEDFEKALDLLVKGEVDLVLSDTINILDFLQSDAGARFDYLGDPLISDLLHAKAHIAVRKGQDQLRDAVNAAILQIRLDGTYDLINRHYFPFSIY